MVFHLIMAFHSLCIMDLSVYNFRAYKLSFDYGFPFFYVIPFYYGFPFDYVLWINQFTILGQLS